LSNAITGLTILDCSKIERAMDECILVKHVNILRGNDQVVLIAYDLDELEGLTKWLSWGWSGWSRSASLKCWSQKRWLIVLNRQSAGWLI
jgi:hypothetical protein